ncbi:MAG: CsbD family protein [Hymenobacteraceae bacterium]|nr:CsbD family protein [Hymenobacteraceae bacterium]MDX5395456.1 CsbD family protein [Hymenobacteraceae bacterium]MDX5443079.1 CsbD family protein [Hymenobacteraceae bacterium]MDX5511505.1 CsbD family protein [Hymenobacteraceae bacterium]
MLSTESGEEMRRKLKRKATRLSDELDRKMHGMIDRLGRSGVTDDDETMILHGNWDDVKGQLKQRYGELTEDDLAYTEGQADELMGNLQRKLGLSAQKVKRMFSNFLD